MPQLVWLQTFASYGWRLREWRDANHIEERQRLWRCIFVYRTLC